MLIAFEPFSAFCFWSGKVESVYIHMQISNQLLLFQGPYKTGKGRKWIYFETTCMNDFLKSNLFDTERTALCTCTSFAFKTVCVKKGLNNIILPKTCLWQERLLKMSSLSYFSFRTKRQYKHCRYMHCVGKWPLIKTV